MFLIQKQVNIQIAPGTDLLTEISQLQATLATVPHELVSVSQTFRYVSQYLLLKKLRATCRGENLDKKDLLGKSGSF